MNFTRTKIICTIGPATEKLSALRKLHSNGMNVARINMSHATHKSAKLIFDRIKKINSETKNENGKIGVLLDTQGPEIRTGDTELPLELKVGEEVTLTVRDQVDVETSSIKINYKDLIHSVSEGSRISVDNGLINFMVLSKDEETLLCKVIDGGKLGSKRHVNLPGVRVNLPSLTAKDLEDINFGIKNKVDFIALSFVRNSEDLEKLQEILDKKKSHAKIIAKIENQEGLDNIHDISKASWGVMVARGDLGIETSLTDLPNIQRRIMYACAKWGRRSIVATHLLESMINNPTPTRAEVTDIANAIYEGADAIMLSGETSVGKYPVECVDVLNKVTRNVERYAGGSGFNESLPLSTTREKLMKSAAWYLSFLERNDAWQKGYDHNQLRITRVIESLRLLVSDEAADEFFKAILRLVKDPAILNPSAMKFWEEA